MRLFSFKAIATGASICVAITRIAYVDFAKRAIIARTVVFTIRYTATDRSIYFSSVFVHHSIFLLTFLYARNFYSSVKTV